MPSIIFKRIVGGWMFAFEGEPSSARRYFGYTKREAYSLYKKLYGVSRAHLEEDVLPFSYGFLY